MPHQQDMQHLQKNLQNINKEKGSVQFPLDKPIPLDLIAKITAFRVTENLAKSKSK